MQTEDAGSANLCSIFIEGEPFPGNITHSSVETVLSSTTNIKILSLFATANSFDAWWLALKGRSSWGSNRKQQDCTNVDQEQQGNKVERAVDLCPPSENGTEFASPVSPFRNSFTTSTLGSFWFLRSESMEAQGKSRISDFGLVFGDLPQWLSGYKNGEIYPRQRFLE